MLSTDLSAIEYALKGSHPKRHEFHRDDLKRMAEVAEELDARSYAGGWVNLLNWQDLTPIPSAVNTFTASTCIASPTPRAFIPANSVNIGTRFRVRCGGTYGITSTPTTTLGIALNGTSGTVICVSASQSPSTSTSNTWWAEFECNIQTVGSSGTIIGIGIAFGLNATATTPILIPASGAATVTFNSTQANSITPNATWSASSASNTYTTLVYSVEQLN